jgi:hypothetical protein
MTNSLNWPQVDLLRFTDPLTLKYLLSNERLDVFCPEVKPKLNAFLEESILMKKRHSSGEAKFQENLKIPVKKFCHKGGLYLPKRCPTKFGPSGHFLINYLKKTFLLF